MVNSYMNTINLNNPYIVAELIEEGFFDSFKQGYKTQYAQSRGDATNDKDLEQFAQKYADKALPVIQKAQGVAQKYSQKLGIPLPLATTLIAAGMSGGVSAIPFVALLYFARRPVNKAAGAAFDYGAQKMGFMPQKAQTPSPISAAPSSTNQAAGSNLWLPGNNNSKPTGPIWVPQNAWTDYSFSSYMAMRDLQEGLGADLKKWWVNKGADKVGSALGKTAGFVSGKASKYRANVGNLLKNSWSELSKFVSENKLSLAKAAFLMGVGSLVGYGVGSLTSSAIDDITQAIGDQGLSAEEMHQLNWLRNNFEMSDLKQDKTGDFHGGGEQIFGTSDDMSVGAKDSDFENPEWLSKMRQQDDLRDNDAFYKGMQITSGERMTTQAVQDSLETTFSSAIRTQVVGQPDTARGVLTYSFEVTPEPGQSPQEILQNAYRDLAKDLAAKNIDLTDLRPYGQDPGGKIRALLSVAPKLAIPGAMAGAAGGFTDRNK